MNTFPHGAIIAAHAAEKQRQANFKEEEMTNYSTDELQQDWEFKIVRSESGAFRNPQTFQALVEEEAIAGWELLEKLDDNRVRFKRRSEKRRRDQTLPPGIDPYRTHYGRDPRTTATAVGLILALVFGLGVLALVFFEDTGSGASAWPIIAIMIPLVMVVVLGISLIVRRR